MSSDSTVTAALAAAGVDRTTVHRWLREDHAFQAAWNRIRREQEREVLARVDHLANLGRWCTNRNVGKSFPSRMIFIQH